MTWSGPEAARPALSHTLRPRHDRDGLTQPPRFQLRQRQLGARAILVERFAAVYTHMRGTTDTTEPAVVPDKFLVVKIHCTHLPDTE